METGTDQQPHGGNAGAAPMDNGGAAGGDAGGNAGASTPASTAANLPPHTPQSIAEERMTRGEAWQMIEQAFAAKAQDEEETRLLAAGLFLFRELVDDLHTLASRPA